MTASGRGSSLCLISGRADLIGVFFAHHEREALRELRARFAGNELQPIALMLAEDQALLRELQAAPFTEPNSGILEAYLAKIRRDGVPKHADMKQKLDQLAENNTAIVTLIMAGGNYAASGVPFPTGFSAAVDAEIAAAR